jgi:hypothetical protein
MQKRALPTLQTVATKMDSTGRRLQLDGCFLFDICVRFGNDMNQFETML